MTEIKSDTITITIDGKSVECRPGGSSGVRVGHEAIDHGLEGLASPARFGKIERPSSDVDRVCLASGRLKDRDQPIERLRGADAIADREEHVDPPTKRRLVGRRSIERQVECRQCLRALAQPSEHEPDADEG